MRAFVGLLLLAPLGCKARTLEPPPPAPLHAVVSAAPGAVGAMPPALPSDELPPDPDQAEDPEDNPEAEPDPAPTPSPAPEQGVPL